jgi:hypothetical protein
MISLEPLTPGILEPSSYLHLQDIINFGFRTQFRLPLIDNTILKGFPDFRIRFLQVPKDEGLFLAGFHTGRNQTLG